MGASEQLDFAQGLISRGMYDMAILQCRKFIVDYPHSAFLQKAYLSLGEAYFLSQDFKKAVDTFNQFKQFYPHSEQLPVSLLRLGQMDIQQKDYNGALKNLTSIDTQKQLKGTMLQSFDFYTAQAYMGKADTASALDYFRKAAQVEGDPAVTAYASKEAGKIDAQNGRYSEAVDAYAKSMRVTQDSSLKGELTYRTAEAEFLLGKYADAIKGFRQVLDQYPSLGFTQDALANLLLAYFNLGQYDQLLNEYHKDVPKIKKEDIYFAIPFAAALAFIELKEYSQANALLDRVLAFPTLKPQERAKIFIKKADILIREGKYKDGLALLNAYSSENTNDADEILFLKAQGYYGLGDFDRAFNLFEKVRLSFPDSRFFKATLLDQANVRRRIDRLKESQKPISQAGQPALKNANTGSARIGYGLSLANARKFEDAKKEFGKALDENADDPAITARARFEMANVEASQGNFNKALKFYLLVAVIYNEDYYCSESLLRAAGIFERFHRKADALKMYSEILDKYKNSVAALKAKERLGLLK